MFQTVTTSVNPNIDICRLETTWLINLKSIVILIRLSGCQAFLLIALKDDLFVYLEMSLIWWYGITINGKPNLIEVYQLLSLSSPV